MKKHERRKVNKKESLGRRLKDDSTSSSVGRKLKAFPDSSINDSSKDFAENPNSLEHEDQRNLDKSPKNKPNCSTKNTHRVTMSAAPCHSYYSSFLSENSRLIKETVDKSPIPMTPKEISQKTGIKRSTVRKSLTRLVRKGFIRKVCYGYYVSILNSVTLGSRMVGVESDRAADVLRLESFYPKVHGLRFTIRDVGLAVCQWELVLDVVKLKFLVHKNGTAQVFVDCDKDYSFDYVGFRLLVDTILKELDVSDWDKVTISSPEWNTDYEGLQLVGAKAVTLRSFDGSFRRIYNKRWGLRDESKVVGSVPLEDALAILKGGVSPYIIYQTAYLALKQVKDQNEHSVIEKKILADAVGHMNRIADAVCNRKSEATRKVCDLETRVEQLETKQQDIAVTDPEPRRHQSLFMKFCFWLNKNVSLPHEVRVKESDVGNGLLRRIGSWLNKEVF